MNITVTKRIIRGYGLRKFFLISFRSIVYKLSQFFEHATVKKTANYIAIKIQKWLRVTKIKGMPYLYVIDPTNACNLKCKLCPTGLGILGRKNGIIDLQKYKSIIDEISPYAREVWLFNWGEPFLHPNILEIIEYASNRKISVRISSNLNRLRENMADQIVLSGLDNLLVSVDGVDNSTYQKYRVGGNLDQVLKNIEAITNAKKKYKSKKPFIYMRMLINRYNADQIEQMAKLASSLDVDALRVGPIYVDTRNEAQVQEWLPVENKYTVYDKSKEELVNVHHCSDLWESVVINWDGGVSPCCWIHNNNYDIGNAFEQSIKSIWNSNQYVISRQVFSRKVKNKIEGDNICTKCKGNPQYLID